MRTRKQKRLDFPTKFLKNSKKTMNIKSIKIAVSGVGGGVGQSIIKALYNTNYTIIGLDGEFLGTGQYAVPRAYKIPYANDPHYIDEVINICQSEKCKIFFPGLDIELPLLSKNVERFNNVGTTVVVSKPDVIDICDDKLQTYSFLSSHSIFAPITFDFQNFLNDPKILDYPIIIKPKKGGARSKNVYLIKEKKDIESFLLKNNFKNCEYVVQEYIEGDEYTCGTVNLDEKCYGIIIMRRILRDGDTYKCFTEKNKIIEDEVKKVADALKPFGACNVQLRFKNGKPYIFEINARCSGTTAARSICGFNEPKMIADYLCYGKKPQYNIKKLAILRYWKELVVDNYKIKKLNKTGFILNKNFKKL